MRKTITVVATLAVLVSATTAHGAQLGAYPTVRGQHGPAFTDHGIVQKNPRVVLVFWGWTPSEASLVAAETDLFANRIPGSAWGGILSQYGVHDDERLVAVVRDPGYPGWKLTRGDFEREALHAQRRLSILTNLDTQWIVFAPLGANATNFPGECGEHGQFGTSHEWPVVFSIVWPYQQDGCGGSVGDETATASHEWAEAVTNPLGNHNKGWWIKVGKHGLQEIADMCDWQLVQPWGPGGPTVQRLWSNANEGPQRNRGCVDALRGT